MLKRNAAQGLFMAFSLLALSGAAEAVTTQFNQPNSNPQSNARVPVRKETDSTTEEKFNIMKRDQIDTTDSLAIPFDESEVEDEQQIDWDEKRDVFPLPHSH